jgi:hypothetical protein
MPCILRDASLCDAPQDEASRRAIDDFPAAIGDHDAPRRPAAALAMKFATFNINNINRRLPNLLQWLKRARPDIACLQELKCSDAEFRLRALNKAGYHAVWRGQKTWNGVAISQGSQEETSRP